MSSEIRRKLLKAIDLEFHILVYLADRRRSRDDCYGYKLRKWLAEHAPSLKAREASVYTVLERLQQKGYIEVTETTYSREHGRKRRECWSVTSAGIQYLHNVTEHWRTLLDRVNRSIELMEGDAHA